LEVIIQLRDAFRVNQVELFTELIAFMRFEE